MRAKRVAIVAKSLPQYREPFFLSLRDRLGEDGIELVLIYDHDLDGERAPFEGVAREWAHAVRKHVLRVGRREIVWQPASRLLRDVDLIVAEQASKLLLNYVLQVRASFGGPRFALWGHGRNLQGATASRAGESIKRFWSRRADWWFAYTDGSAQTVKALGYPSERITIVQNAVDSRALVAQRQSVSTHETQRLREALNLHGTNVGVYAGAMYPEKRVGILLDACQQVRESIPDFELVVIGSGVDAPLVRDRAAKHCWIKYVGPKFGREKVVHFSLAKLLLLPGAVGLGVLDSFALETPLVTLDRADHGPEIEYLQHGENGLVVDVGSAASYAAAVIQLLRDGDLHARLRRGCRSAAELYTLEAMVERFAAGVRTALES